MRPKLITQSRFFEQEKGQSLIIFAFSIVAIVFMLGLALDLGLVYIERVALKRAIDAAVLSGVVELPNEQDAGERALEYLALNGYDLDETEVYFAGCIRDPNNPTQWINPAPGTDGLPEFLYWDGDPNKETRNWFYLNTYDFNESNNLNVMCSPVIEVYGEANKLEVTGRVRVDMNFMSIVGARDFVDVAESGIAQNIDSLDVAVAVDKSGSMEFDATCYGCWERTETPNDHQNDSPRWLGYYNYPANGVRYPIGGDPASGDGFYSTTVQNMCRREPFQIVDPAQAVYRDPANSNRYYIVMEAELFGFTDPPLTFEFREQNKGFWILQRGEANYDDNNTPFFDSQGYSIDTKGAHMAHHPIWTTNYGRHYTLAEAQNGAAPVLEYDFRLRDGGGIDWTNLGSTGAIWVRIHRGRGLNVDAGSPQWGDSGDGRAAYWTIASEAAPASQDPNDPSMTMNGIGFVPSGITTVPTGQFPADMGRGFHWVYLGSFNINPSNFYRFYFYAGSSGFALDQIVVTNHTSSTYLPTNVRDGNVPVDNRHGVATRAACDPCNEIYGMNVVENGTTPLGPYDVERSLCNFYRYTTPRDNRLHPLFGDYENPMRSAKEALKQFANALDPERDQLGFVAYNTAVRVRTELECKRRYPGNCTDGSVFSYTQVMRDIESVFAGGGTDIADGMKEGLEVLGVDIYDPNGQSNLGTTCPGNVTCSRGASAQRILIVTTDGVPNDTPGGVCDSAGPSYSGSIASGGTQAGYDCVIYFADQARQRGVTVFVIGIGFGVDQPFLEEAARVGGGNYYFTATGADMSQIFADILSNIYVRLIE